MSYPIPISELQSLYLKSLKSFANAMLVLLSKSTANVTIHPRAIAYFFLMFPFQLEGKNPPKKEKRGKILFFILAHVCSTLFYGLGHPGRRLAPQPAYHPCVVSKFPEVVMELPSGTRLSPRKEE